MRSQRFSDAGAPLESRERRSDVVRDFLSLLLPMLTTLGALLAFWLLYQAFTMPAPASPMPSAARSSDDTIGATLSVSPSPLLVIVLTPANTPTPRPVLWQTATAEARLTATATWKPQACPASQAEIDAMTPGTLCVQPTGTPIPAPTSTPILGCDPAHWLPGEVCQIGAPFAPTPTATASVESGHSRGT